MSSDDLAYIRTKVDSIDQRLSDNNEILAVNTKQLEIHIKRTDILENEVKIIRDHVVFVNTLVKIIIAVSVPIITFIKLFSN